MNSSALNISVFGSTSRWQSVTVSSIIPSNRYQFPTMPHLLLNKRQVLIQPVTLNRKSLKPGTEERHDPKRTKSSCILFLYILNLSKTTTTYLRGEELPNLNYKACPGTSWYSDMLFCRRNIKREGPIGRIVVLQLARLRRKLIWSVL